MRNPMRPVHPGEVLQEEYLVPLNMSASALAAALGVPANRTTLLVREARAVTADTALRLALYFGTTPKFWLALQSTYDLRVAEREAGTAIRKALRPMRVAKARQTREFFWPNGVLGSPADHRFAAQNPQSNRCRAWEF